MVDVGGKAETVREAVADAEVHMGPGAIQAIRRKVIVKGDPLQAGPDWPAFMAAKRTSDLIPPLSSAPLTHVNVDLVPKPFGYLIVARAGTVGRTGVEMEALVAASVAALTLLRHAPGRGFERSSRADPPPREAWRRKRSLSAELMTPSVTPATIAELPFFVAGRFSKPDLIGRSAGDPH
jgi:cyclic pyranopterin phosphate synthase